MNKLLVLCVVVLLLVGGSAFAQGFDHQKGWYETVAADTITGSTCQWGDSLKRVAGFAPFTPLDTGAFYVVVTGEVTLSPGQRLYIAIDRLRPDSATGDTGMGWTYLSCPPEFRGGSWTMPFTFYSNFVAVKDSGVVVDSIGVKMSTGSSADNIIVRKVKAILGLISEKAD
jgi:hypothetical protein